MQCDNCKKNEATIHITQTINGKTQERHLCSECAAKLGMSHPFKPYLEDWLKPVQAGQSIFDPAGGIPAFGSPATRKMVCPACGQRYDDFRRSGLLGCSQCYEAFGDRLDAIFRRVQGGTRHIGRKACETAEQQEIQLYRHQLIEMKKQLQQYVNAEEYEKAASLRDEIHELNGQIKELEQKGRISNCRSGSDQSVKAKDDSDETDKNEGGDE